MLQRLMNVNPTSIYWGYMGLRAAKLKLPFDTPEDGQHYATLTFCPQDCFRLR